MGCAVSILAVCTSAQPRPSNGEMLKPHEELDFSLLEMVLPFRVIRSN